MLGHVRANNWRMVVYESNEVERNGEKALLHTKIYYYQLRVDIM